MAVAAILDSRNREILLAYEVQSAKTHHVPNFVKIGQ